MNSFIKIAEVLFLEEGEKEPKFRKKNRQMNFMNFKRKT